jgi:hypothetical protein
MYQPPLLKSDDAKRNAFHNYLVQRYMGETLLFYLEVEKYDMQKKLGKKAEMAGNIFQRFFDPSSGSHDMLTLAADQVQLVEERIASQAYDGLFREVNDLCLKFF